MKKEWFEPGPDGVSPFEREMQKEWRTTNIPKGISAAFRALLAEDAPAVDKDAEIARLTAEVEQNKSRATCWRAIVDVLNDIAPGWQAESDNHEQAAVSVIYSIVVERDAARAEVERLTALRAKDEEMAEIVRQEIERMDKAIAEVNEGPPAYRITIRNQRNELAALNKAYTKMRAECHSEIDRLVRLASEFVSQRDALQSLVDGGVRVWSIDSKDWHVERCLADNHSATLLIDRIADPGEMVDERKGEETTYQRFGITYFDWSCSTPKHRAMYGSPCQRRRAAGTRADRGKA